ncbi:MAG: LysR family transcriptional regulator [Bdellovibrionales bacterium]|nr:LysR family transcriptional regulator [Bdellovibrionales bacterium]
MDIYSNRQSDIKMKEILLFVELCRTKNMRELARKTGIMPGQISKLIKSLEQKTNLRLLERSARGVQLSAEAGQYLPHFEKMYQQHLKFQDSFQQERSPSLLSFATTSFLSAYVLAPMIASFGEKTQQEYRFRILDLSPDTFTSAGLRSGFEYALHIGNLDWPKTWYSQQLGKAQWHLYANASHVLAGQVAASDLADFPFVYPVYWSETGVQFGDDGCPLPYNKRLKGHETATAISAIEIVKRSQQIGFLPEIVARPYIDSGAVKKIEVENWQEVSRPIYFTVKNDLVKKNLFDRLRVEIEEVLENTSRRSSNGK